jgi:hypothetical protein
MGFWNIFSSRKNTAYENNYKLDLFETISKNAETADMSAIKRYFDRLYEQDALGFNAFSVNQDFEGIYAAEPTNKIRRLQDYRSMSTFPEIASALDTICYAADSPDENNQLVTLRVNDNNLEAKDIERIREAAQEYFDLFDFDNNFIEFFRKLLVDRTAMLGKYCC